MWRDLDFMCEGGMHYIADAASHLAEHPEAQHPQYAMPGAPQDPSHHHQAVHQDHQQGSQPPDYAGALLLSCYAPLCLVSAMCAAAQDYCCCRGPVSPNLHVAKESSQRCRDWKQLQYFSLLTPGTICNPTGVQASIYRQHLRVSVRTALGAPVDVPHDGAPAIGVPSHMSGQQGGGDHKA